MGRINEKYKNKTLVAVYGSLKKGFQLNHVLSDSKYLGKGETFDRYLMTNIDRIPINSFQRTNKKYQEFKKEDLDNGPFPYVFYHSDGFNIIVEVYEITEEKLKELDMIEGVPNHYIRRKVECILNRNRIQCEMYFINENIIDE